MRPRSWRACTCRRPRTRSPDASRGPDPSFLTWHDLRLLEQDGFEIGSHTVDHRPLTALPDATVRWELRASRRALERRLGRLAGVSVGAFGSRVAAIARRVGYRLAATTIPTYFEDGRHPLELGRLEVLDTTTLPQFAALLTGR